MDIQKKVITLIVDKLGVEEADVKLDASFTDDLGADSLDIVELVMDFETEFEIKIEDVDAETITTVGAAIDFITKAVG